MKAKEEFHKILDSIDGQPFERYSEIAGDFDFTRYVVKMVALQERPGVGRTAIFLRVPQTIADFPPALFEVPVRRTALEDYLTRRLGEAVARLCPSVRGRETSGRVDVDLPRSAVVPRTSMVVTDEYVECRIGLDLPARDGRILGRVAHEIFFEEFPQVVNQALVHANLDPRDVRRFVDFVEQSDQVRQAMTSRGLVAFVEEGSHLHANGDDLYGPEPVPLESPQSLRITLDLPDGRSVTGLGIPQGITVITGPAFSGKSTLLQALQEGVYYHAPRPKPWRVVTQFDCIGISSEPGRSVQGVDVSGFIGSLPGQSDPGEYTSLSADVLLSQAAGLMEALEVGCRCILIDEDESAPTFLTGDDTAAELFGESATGHVSLARRLGQLKADLGVSFIIAAENPGELLSAADRVLVMNECRLTDVTEKARESAKPLPTPATPFPAPRLRRIIGSSLDASVGLRDPAIDVEGVDVIHFGRDRVDLRHVRQIADEHQARTIAMIIHYAKLRYMNEESSLSEILDRVERDMASEGIDVLTRDMRGDLARPRRFEVAAVVNRLRSMRVRRDED
jgi:predicted ABC-class ATPase